jgi:hypothetical protein
MERPAVPSRTAPEYNNEESASRLSVPGPKLAGVLAASGPTAVAVDDFSVEFDTKPRSQSWGQCARQGVVPRRI